MSPRFVLGAFVVAFVFCFAPFAAIHLWGTPTSLVPIGLLFAITAAAVFTALSSRAIARELGALTETAKKMASGNLELRTGIEGDHPVARLGAALDGLAVSLSTAMGELRREHDLVVGILDGMQEGVLLLDGDGNIELVNPTLRSIFLVKDGAVGRRFIDVVRHAPLTELLDQARRHRATRSAEIELAGLMPRRLLVRAAPRGPHTRALLVVFVDVTDLRRLESMRRDFVANVSHELRTPVTAVLSAAETLSGGAMKDDVMGPKFLDIVERNAARLRSLIDDLLDLSRIEAKEFRLSRETVDIANLVQQVVSAASTRAAAAKVELVTAIDPAARQFVSDRRALEQVLTNLVENAIKYSPDARVTVNVGLDAKGGLLLSVVDTGPGIEARHLSRIFERFYRVDPGRSRELGGTGLGLSIVKHLVEALGGTVVIESTVGSGTKCIVDLPRQPESGPKLS